MGCGASTAAPTSATEGPKAPEAPPRRTDSKTSAPPSPAPAPGPASAQAPAPDRSNRSQKGPAPPSRAISSAGIAAAAPASPSGHSSKAASRSPSAIAAAEAATAAAQAATAEAAAAAERAAAEAEAEAEAARAAEEAEAATAAATAAAPPDAADDKPAADPEPEPAALAPTPAPVEPPAPEPVAPGVAVDSPLLDCIRAEAFTIRDAVKEALPGMPFPVSAAAKEVVTLASQAAAAFANADNLASLRQRAVAGLALLHAYGDLLRAAPPPPGAAAAAAAATGGASASGASGMGLHAAVSAFRDIVSGMTAYARPYCSRGAIVHMCGADAGGERGVFERLVGELTALTDEVEGRARGAPGWEGVPGRLHGRVDEALLVLRLGPGYTDHLGRLQGAVRGAGGLEAVCKAPEAFLDSALVIQELSLGSKITKELAIELLSAHADRGPCRLLAQPELRLLWRAEFGGAGEVGWDAWWAAFPARLAALPGLGMRATADKLGQLLADDAPRAAFQRFVLAADNLVPVAGRGAGAADRMAAHALAAAFGAPLSEAAAAGFDDLPAEVAAGLAAAGGGGAAGVAVEGPCQLPPLPAWHVPREELCARVAAALGAGGERCRAVCLVAPGGLGKTTLATEAAWRLVRGGACTGGCVWVDLAGARTWQDCEARLSIALGLLRDNADGRPRIAATLRACCSPARPLLLAIDTIDDPLRCAGAAEGLWELLDKVVGGCPGVRLLACSTAPLALGEGAAGEIVTIEVPPMSPTTAAALAAALCPDLPPEGASRLALAARCLPLGVRLLGGARAEGRLSLQDIEAIGASAARPRASAPLSDPGPGEVMVAVTAAVLTALPTHLQVSLLQMSVLPPAGAGPEAALAALGAPGPASPAAVPARAALAALGRQGLAGQGTLPGRRAQAVMHSLVRGVVAGALAPALDLTVRPAAEERLAAATLTSLAGWAKGYGGREGGAGVLAAARAAQPEVAELLALYSRTTPRLSSSGFSAPPSPDRSPSPSPELAAAAAVQRLPLEAVLAAARAFNGDLAELLAGLGLLPALEPVCEALSAPAVGLVANRSAKVEMANVYRIHALALTAQGKFEEAQAHGNMCIHLRSDAARINPASPAIASAAMSLAAAYVGMRCWEAAEELLRQASDICVGSLGESSPHTAWALGALAGALEAQHAKVAEAEGLYRRALAARQAAQGPHHPRTIEAALALAAHLATHQARPAEALPLFEDAAAAALRVFGEFHAATAAAISGAASAKDAVAEAAGDAAAAASVAEGTAAAHERAAAIVEALELAGGEAAAAAFGRGRNAVLRARGEEAEPMLRRAVELAGRCLPRDAQGREQPLMLAGLLAHGRCLLGLGPARAAEAQAVLERAMQAQVRLLGTQAHPHVAAVARDLAAAALATRRWAAAEPLCRQALATAQHGVGMESEEAALALSQYARCVCAQGRWGAAEPLLRQALELRSTKLDPEGRQPATATCRTALAECLAAQGDAAGAEAHWRAAHDALKGALVDGAAAEGVGQERVLAAAGAAHGLGACLVEQSKGVEEAEGVLRASLNARRQLLGQAHKDTVASLACLAACLGARGQHSEAEGLLHADLEAANQAHGPQHPNAATAMSALAGCLQAQGKLDEAEPLFMAARNICTSQLGPDHPNTLTVTANLAACLGAQGRHAEALPLHQAELEATKRVQGEGHPDVATSLNHLATCLQALGRLEEAEAAARQAVALLKAAGRSSEGAGTGAPNPAAALVANTLGLVLLAAGRVGEAVAALEEALAVCSSRLGPLHPWTTSTQKNLEAAQKAAKQ